MSENSTENVSQPRFPTDLVKYRYQYRIAEIKRASVEYNQYLYPLIYSNTFESLSNCSEIVEQLKEFQIDFNSCAKKIINKEGIDSEEQYRDSFHLLMCIAHQTIIFVSKNFSLLRLKERKKKYNCPKITLKTILDSVENYSLLQNNDFSQNKKEKLSNIIFSISNVVYILNPDNDVFIMKYHYIIAIVALTIIGLVFTVLAFILSSLISFVVQSFTGYDITESCHLVFSIVTAVALSFVTISALFSPRFDLEERKKKAYIETYDMVFHLNKRKDFLSVLDVILEYAKKILDIKGSL